MTMPGRGMSTIFRATTTMAFFWIPMALADKSPRVVEQRTMGRMLPPPVQRRTRPQRRQETGRMPLRLLQAWVPQQVLPQPRAETTMTIQRSQVATTRVRTVATLKR